jgi:tetratricopeptide (TPR) repeat protein
MPVEKAVIAAARAALAAGRAAEVDRRCLELLRDDPQNAELLHLQGMARCQTGQLVEGAQLLERAIDIAPGLTAAHADLGALLVRLGRTGAAVERLQIAFRLDPLSTEIQLNLGNALHAHGELESAEEHYRAVLRRDPGNARANLSLGNLLCQVRRAGDAIEYLTAAAALAPAVAAVHQALGTAHGALGRPGEAMASFQRALAIEPGNPEANVRLGLILKGRNRLEDALACFRAAETHYARAQALECLLRQGRHEQFFAEIAQHPDEEAGNLHSAGLSAYAAHKLSQPDPHPFCPDPLSSVRVVDRYRGTGADARFLADLMREAGQLNAVWEPRGVSTTGGYQTGGKLFESGGGALGQLALDLVTELNRYHDEMLADRERSGTALCRLWPATPRLHGWYVRLLTGGHQRFHNHSSGWMSGCVYLQVPGPAMNDEGAIEFGLAGDDFPGLSGPALPTRRHNPVPGQIVLFPSSLFHRTIAFGSLEERLCICFDLLPGRAP